MYIHLFSRTASVQKAGDMDKVNILKKLDLIRTYWDPKIVGQLNGQDVKLVKFSGSFVWHAHRQSDEMFFVIDGTFEMQFRDQSVHVGPGEFIIVPRGVEHCPRSDEEVHLMLFEPAGTLNTGDAVDPRTVEAPEML